MSKEPSPKADALRAMREQKFKEYVTSTPRPTRAKVAKPVKAKSQRKKRGRKC